MEKFEQEPKFNLVESLVEELKAAGFYISRPEVGENEAPVTCDGDDKCFNDAEWFIEGSFRCSEHAEKMLLSLKEMEDTREQRIKEQEEKVKKLREDTFGKYKK